VLPVTGIQQIAVLCYITSNFFTQVEESNEQVWYWWYCYWLL